MACNLSQLFHSMSNDTSVVFDYPFLSLFKYQIYDPGLTCNNELFTRRCTTRNKSNDHHKSQFHISHLMSGEQ